jgi:predicted ribosome quality control (RQC) complex YloA/Tae2 family protein
MALSLPELQDLAHALAEALVDARCQRVRALQSHPQALVLGLRTPGQSHDLLIDLSPGATRLHRIADLPPQPQTPPAFVMLLRKWLVGARLVAFATHADDRITQLAFDAGGHPLRLIAELTGNHGNLLLVDADDRILGTLVSNKSRVRDLRPGRTWVPPAPPTGTPPPRRADWPNTLPERERFLEQTYAGQTSEDDESERLRTTLRAVRAALKRAKRRRQALERDAENVRQADAHKRHAELLQQAYGRAKRGDRFVEVVDYYAADQPRVRLPLDPALDLQGNIDRAFHQYRRFTRGADTVAERIASTDRGLEALEEMRDALDAIASSGAIDAEALDAIAEAIARHPDAPKRKVEPGSRRGSSEAPRLPYHRFESVDGLDILVGRGSSDNDTLTFRVARGRDRWLHAADAPGSHVIIRTPANGEIPHATLIEAALLAAHYSKARTDTVVTVRHTDRKHLRKPKGAAAGRVSVAGGKTVDVRPDDPRLSALLAQQGRGRQDDPPRSRRAGASDGGSADG